MLTIFFAVKRFKDQVCSELPQLVSLINFYDFSVRESDDKNIQRPRIEEKGKARGDADEPKFRFHRWKNDFIAAGHIGLREFENIH